MLDLIREVIGWARAYVVHVVVMFYWAWIPGILGAAILSARYRSRFQAIVLKRPLAAAGIWAATGWGMLSGVGRKANLTTAERLRGEGAPEPVVLAYLVASHTLGLYLLLLITFLIGSAFSLGLFLGGLVMIGLLCLVAPLLGPEPPGPCVRTPRKASHPRAGGGSSARARASVRSCGRRPCRFATWPGRCSAA